MPRAHLLDETPQCMQHVGERLSRAGLGEEHDEVDRVTLMQGHTDFGVALEAADSRPVPRARIDDDHRRFARIDAVLPAGVADLQDPEQRISGRANQSTTSPQGQCVPGPGAR